ncbi:hypothetical protein [Cognatilysobacter segetis]|uniref:hypothetical protein n=1 Tax=Cognatilysobacter segetis TaxID=2492394 RepID=UPI00105EA002|nr:hypothetical protein [Lysobacter segetis]
MVRNPRTLMVCSLLALATGMALGSRLAPGASDAAADGWMTPALADRLAAWQGHRWARPAVAVDGPAGNAITVDIDTAPEAAGLEGGRHPRMPRMSRDTMARAAR